MTKTDPEPDDRLSGGEVMARVTLVAPGVVLMREVPAPTATTVRQLFGQAETLLGDQQMHALIADLREIGRAGLPSAEVRSLIRKEFEHHQPRRIGLVFPPSKLYLVAARFIVAPIKSADVHIFKSPEEALAAFRHD